MQVMKRNFPRYSASTVITSNINSKQFIKDPVLAAIADMVEGEPRGANHGHGGRNGQRGNDIKCNHGDSMHELEAMLDRKLAPFLSKFTELERNIDSLRNQVQFFNDETRQAIGRQGHAIDHLMNGTNYLMVRDNTVEQRDRDPGQRIDNFKVPENSSPLEIADKIYNELYKPMFIEAAKDGLLPKREVVHLDEMDDKGEPKITKSTVVDLPLPGEVIEYCHTLGGGRPSNLPPGAQPRRAARTPTIIVKLQGRITKDIINRYKKSTLQKINQTRHLGEKDSISIYDDLTKVNLNCLNKLKETTEVQEAFSLGGKIRFSLRSNPMKKHIVHNLFAINIEGLKQYPINPLI